MVDPVDPATRLRWCEHMALNDLSSAQLALALQSTGSWQVPMVTCRFASGPTLVLLSFLSCRMETMSNHEAVESMLAH